ncbi:MULTISPECIES: acyl-CoA dehydrogenase family protein [Marinobacter]|uniref:Acyl-CoA dehydrogenase n=1 Tax=Marinobacter profundi TaxID=2666256 RepID=A0A2G1UJ45_9GAMM|nr:MULTISPECIES: acyl-CoA dehydrogenase family protein [Marinobacter]MBD3656998.1 acyl-CoA dehydrogenase family protein [Marinobacter sp.]PHQ14504.1 acyl-CoA dehydrogenase [Marinobacter profundi]
MESVRFNFPAPEIDQSVDELRKEVRAFLDEERRSGGFVPVTDCWCAGVDPAFSRKLGRQGWIGVTWPRQYGGRELSALHRYVITEELLVAGAPVHAHWIADRQSGPLILATGTEDMKRNILPRIAAGECFVALGLSEPESGSDLASVRTRAHRVEGGWEITGTKLWSSGAQHCQYMTVLARTGERDPNRRHEGLTQFLVPLDSPGVTVRGIRDMSGVEHFNESHFEKVFVPDDAVLGQVGEGWKQITSELALERSGPERFLSTFVALERALQQGAAAMTGHQAAVVGSIIARIRALRAMSLGVAALLGQGHSPEVEAALVKDLGTRLEQDIIERLREFWPVRMKQGYGDELQYLLSDSLLRQPSFTLRGGTNEVLKGIIARGMGLR